MDDTKPQKIDPKDDWYKVRAGDCSLYVALISGNAFPVVDFPILV
jgi:hypothetical protein